MSLSERIRNFKSFIKYGPAKGFWARIKRFVIGDEHLPLAGEGDDYPMYWVNWYDAMAFCARLTEQERETGQLPDGHEYRLPTEAEWEYACRADSTTRFANGDTEADLDAIGWHSGNSRGTSHPVGTKVPNAWGLYDMHGNMSEWCLARREYPSVSVTGSQVAVTDRVVSRGGGWRYDDVSSCRAASRHELVQLSMNYFLGFRIVLAPNGGDGSWLNGSERGPGLNGARPHSSEEDEVRKSENDG